MSPRRLLLWALLIVAGGHIGPAQGPGDAFLQALDLEGTPVWNTRFVRLWEDVFDDPGAEQLDVAQGVKSDLEGRLVVVGTGWNWESGGRYALMRLYGAPGELLDSREYRHDGEETLGSAVSIGPSGHTFLGAFDRDGLMLVTESAW